MTLAAMLQAENWALSARHIISLKHAGHHQGGDGRGDHDLDQSEGRLARAPISGCVFWSVNLHEAGTSMNLVVQDDLATIMRYL